VASFIGNPPMNLLQCTVDTSQKSIQFLEESITIQLPETSSHAGLNINPHEQITMGIRPEYIHIRSEPTETAIPGTLYVIQNLGGEILVIVRFGQQLLSIRIFEEETPELPEKVWLDLDFDHVFFYGPDGNLLQ
ncbi:MAG: TOBE domain-containing protein, partial [Anaerolineae bacterium]|nr:TOBE domain-containing protein [Anaerolineae bacterium]